MRLKNFRAKGELDSSAEAAKISSAKHRANPRICAAEKNKITRELRQHVAVLPAAGMDCDEIADAVGCSERMLRTYFCRLTRCRGERGRGNRRPRQEGTSHQAGDRGNRAIPIFMRWRCDLSQNLYAGLIFIRSARRSRLHPFDVDLLIADNRGGSIEPTRRRGSLSREFEQHQRAGGAQHESHQFGLPRCTGLLKDMLQMRFDRL